MGEVLQNQPDPAALVEARRHIEKALGSIVDAAVAMRGGGWEENAGELMRSHRHLGVWTAPNGWLDHLEKEDGGTT